MLFYLLEATISFNFSTLAPVRSATLALFLMKMKVGMAVIYNKNKIFTNKMLTKERSDNNICHVATCYVAVCLIHSSQFSGFKTYIVFSSNVFALVHVHLEEHHILHGLIHLLQVRGNHLAWATPYNRQLSI